MILPSGMHGNLSTFLIIGVDGTAPLDVHGASGVSLQSFTRLVRRRCHKNLLVLFIVDVNGRPTLDGVGDRHGCIVCCVLFD